MSEAKIDKIPCIFPASREFRFSETGSLETASSTGESGELPITSEGSARFTGTDRRKPLQLWRGSQKVADETRYRCRILEVRRMTGARDDMDPRAGEALRELVRVY